ncbi:MAG: hypothetical protein ACKO1T_10790 [Sediminibacterium sp.]
MATYSFNGMFREKEPVTIGNFQLSDYLAFSKKLVKRIEESSFTGIFCLYTPIVFTIFSFAYNVFYDALALYLNVMISFGLVLRAVAYVWIGKIARKKGLNQNRWQIYSLIAPSVSLITIGYNKEKKPKFSNITIIFNPGKVYSTQKVRPTQQHAFTAKQVLYRKVS